MKPPQPIEQMMAEHICGILSADKLPALEAALTNPDYQQHYQVLKQRFMDIGAIPNTNRLAPEIVAHTRRSRRLRSAIAVAATLIVGLSILFYFYFSTRPDKDVTRQGIAVTIDDGDPLDLHQPTGTIAGGRYSFSDSIFSINADGTPKEVAIAVPAGNTFILMLPDSTVVRLNAGSHLTFTLPFTGRNVSLQGEGYFMVYSNQQAPFTVQAAATRVTVLGTTFNINVTDQASPCITLVKGAVMVYDHADSVLLKPSWSAIRRGGQFISIPADFEMELSWIKGLHYFNNQPLDQLAVQMARIYGKKVLVESGGDEKITGSLQTRKLLPSLQQLAASGLIKFRFGTDSTLFLSSGTLPH